MPSAICPYLGLIDDPDTCLAFPTERNACQRTVPAEPISLEHQSSYCLTYKYTECPIYMGETLPAMNADRARARRSRMMRRGCILIWLFVIIFGILALIPVLRNYQSSEARQSSTSDSNNVLVIPATQTPTETAVPPSPTIAAVIPTLAPSPTLCFPPEGWVPYVLSATDDVNLLASAVGLTLQELQQANCGADLLDAKAGDAIFIPFIPSPTPSPDQLLTPTETVISIIIVNTGTPTPTFTPLVVTATPYVAPTATAKPPKSNPPTSRPPSTPPDSRP